MLMVVDANVLFSSLVSSQGVTRRLLLSWQLEFISPEFIEEEVKKYFSELVVKSKCSETDARTFLLFLRRALQVTFKSLTIFARDFPIYLSKITVLYRKKLFANLSLYIILLGVQLRQNRIGKS